MSIETAHFSFLIERGRFAEAEALLRAALAKDPDDAGLYLHLSRVLARLERPKEAQDAARRAIGLEPDWALPHEVLAEALINSSNLKEAEEAVNSAMALGGEDADLRALLARIFLDRNKPEISLEHATAGLAINPEHDTCRFFRTIALGQLNRHDEADESALGLLSDDPDDSTNHSARGWILLERNAFPEARMHFQEALRIDPDNEDARMGLVRCLQQGNAVLGWFLRLILRIGKVSFPKLMGIVIIFGIVLPTFLKSEGQPEFLRIIGLVIRTAFLLFFYVAMAARPLFDCILWVSRDGRLALGPYETRAIRWCCLPLLAGFFYLGLWVVGGSKSIPFTGVGWMATAELFYEGFCNRHGWVRRRLLGIAAVACGAALWFSVGQPILLKPIARKVVSNAEAFARKNGGVTEKELRSSLEHLMRARNWAFVYPAFLLFILASYSHEVASALERRAPDEPD